MRVTMCLSRSFQFGHYFSRQILNSLEAGKHLLPRSAQMQKRDYDCRASAEEIRTAWRRGPISKADQKIALKGFIGSQRCGAATPLTLFVSALTRPPQTCSSLDHLANKEPIVSAVWPN